MNASKLSKKITPVKNILITTLILGFSSLSYGELAAEGSPQETSDLQFNKTQCSSSLARVNEKHDNFTKSCVNAGLGSEGDCKVTIKECQGTSAKDNDKCLANLSTDEDKDKALDRKKEILQHQQEAYTTAESREDKLNERVEKLQTDFNASKQESLKIAARKDQADQDVAKILKSIETAKKDALERELLELKKIEQDNIATRDKIEELNLQLQSFILENQTECFKKAEDYRVRYISFHQKRKASGKTARYKLHTVLRTSGMSLEDIATIKADQKLNRCSSPTAVTKKGTARTPFGARLALQTKIINRQKKIYERNIALANSQRALIKKHTLETLRKLDAEKRSALAAQTNNLMRLAQEITLLQQKEKQILDNLNSALLARQEAGKNRITANSKVVLANEQLSQAYSEKGNSISNKKKEAFLQAQSDYQQLKNSLKSYASNTSSCEHNQYISSLLKGYELEDSSTDYNNVTRVTSNPTTNNVKKTTRKVASSDGAENFDGNTVSR